MKIKTISIFLVFQILVSQLIFAQTPIERGVVNKTTNSQTAEKRLALVLGNGAYQFTDKLKNPVHDANDVAASLKKLGFEVITGTDLTLPQMRKMVREFGTKLQQQKGIGLFYYAGHGVQVNGRNYLIPVDANIETETETPDYSVDTDLVLRFMRDAGNDFNMVILDACRNNPFARSWRSLNPSRDVGNDQGLARITPPSGTIILYSTEPGSVASDGNNRNGLFTESLLANISKPNVEFDAMVKLLARDVKAKSVGKQSPWKEGLYDGEFYFGGVSSSPIQTNPTTNSKTGEQAFWQEIEKQNSISGYERYLAEYPEGEFIKVAKIRLGKLKWEVFKLIAQKLLKYYKVNEFSEGLAATSSASYIDKSGSEIIFPLNYNGVGDFSEGFARVWNRTNGLKRKYGFINKKGEEIIPPKYDAFGGFKDGLADVKLNGKTGFIDKTGKVIIELRYDDTWGFEDDLASVKLNDKWGFIDKTGTIVIPIIYEKALWFSEGMAAVKLNNKFGFIDKTGKEIIPVKYDDAWWFWGGLAAVKLDNKIGFIEKSGELVIPFKSYEQMSYFYKFEEGLLAIRVNGKSGYLKRDGESIFTSSQFDDNNNFKYGLAKVYLNSRQGWINKTLELVIPTKYDIWCEAFIKEGFIGIILDGKKGFVDIYGNEYFDF